VELVRGVFDEIVSMFPSKIIHIGGDEALPKGACTFQSIHDVEKQIQEHLIRKHDRTPMGWNEVFSSPKESEPNGAIVGQTILQNWKGTGDSATISAGFVSIDSEYKKLYENEQCCRVHPSKEDGPEARYQQCFWFDVTSSLVSFFFVLHLNFFSFFLLFSHSINLRTSSLSLLLTLSLSLLFTQKINK
jgi:N-acetyl-beta-hexosaminidase